MRIESDVAAVLSFPAVVLAGLAGGVAEIAWVALYGAITGADAAQVAVEVTRSFVTGVPASSAVVIAGVGIHLVLSVALALAYVRAVWSPWVRGRSGQTASLAALIVLAAIWGFNFFIALPQVNPTFITLMPYGVTLVSKLLFGLAMAGVLIHAERVSARPQLARRTAAARVMV